MAHPAPLDDPTFFATVAQVIPVLWLALAIDKKMGQEKDAGFMAQASLIAISIMSATAEFIAIAATTSPVGSPAFAKLFVAVAAIILVAVLMQSIVVPAVKSSERRDALGWVAVAFLALSPVIAFFALIKI